MPVNPLPPQAYTKDTLQKAYSWLLSQAPSVKEMAQDQNMLVSLYLKALRNGDVSLETPSIQNFKQELKSLANMMGDFQSPQQLATAASQTNASATAAAVSTSHVTKTTVSQSRVSTDTNSAGFDQKTLEAILQVRETFNLSSDNEAIRALVALGIKQFRKTGL
ncbi:MAG: hypothetical protein V4654_10775 [Bdellovibrionota bacterium]